MADKVEIVCTTCQDFVSTVTWIVFGVLCGIAFTRFWRGCSGSETGVDSELVASSLDSAIGRVRQNLALSKSKYLHRAHNNSIIQ